MAGRPAGTYNVRMRTAPVLLLPLAAALFLSSCTSVELAPAPVRPGEPAAPPGAPAAGNDEARQLAKDLRAKERELGYLDADQLGSAIDREMRVQGAEHAVTAAQVELDKARHELELFLTHEKPTEIEERRISFASQTHYSEEAKDELAELEAMYQADEFAKTTKELVLKRGRRKVELAERNLAIAARNLEVLEKQTLPRKEEELKRKVADAERALQRATRDREKTMLELELTQRKTLDKRSDLVEEVAELKAKLAKVSS